MQRRTTRELLALVAAAAVVLIIALGWMWKRAVDSSGPGPAEPFRIAGNFYYVGADAVSAFLITGPEGHIVLDGGYPVNGPMVVSSITQLGFKIKDVKVLVNSVPHREYAGGLAAIQRASGARLWSSEASARVLASGGDDTDMVLPIRALVQVGVIGFPPARVDHQFTDGDTIRVGPIAITAHLTGGSSRGCTSWSFPVRDGERVLNVVSVCPLGVIPGMGYAEQSADIERGFRTLRNLPADIWVTASSRSWGRYNKFAASRTMKNPADAFVDPDGYRAFIDEAETRFRQDAAR